MLLFEEGTSSDTGLGRRRYTGLEVDGNLRSTCVRLLL